MAKWISSSALEVAATGAVLVGLVDQSSASWNRLTRWLRRLDRLRDAA
jgi:hypothetical protein